MQLPVLFSCLVVVCVSVPLEKLSPKQVVEIIRYSSKIQDNGRLKRDENEYLNDVFDHIDADLNGHITAEEFAQYYVNIFQSFGMTTDEWMDAFEAAIEEAEYSKEGNGELELDEFALLVHLGNM